VIKNNKAGSYLNQALLHPNKLDCYLALPILNILVPQVGQAPVVAGFLFFIVTALGFFISFLARHLTQ
jgi:hypothetical protein